VQTEVLTPTGALERATMRVLSSDHDLDERFAWLKSPQGLNGECRVIAHVSPAEENQDAPHGSRTRPRLKPVDTEFVPEKRKARTEKQLAILRYAARVARLTLVNQVLIQKHITVVTTIRQVVDN
jgi:hypothetical protein